MRKSYSTDVAGPYAFETLREIREEEERLVREECKARQKASEQKRKRVEVAEDSVRRAATRFADEQARLAVCEREGLRAGQALYFRARLEELESDVREKKMELAERSKDWHDAVSLEKIAEENWKNLRGELLAIERHYAAWRDEQTRERQKREDLETEDLRSRTP